MSREGSSPALAESDYRKITCVNSAEKNKSHQVHDWQHSITATNTQNLSKLIEMQDFTTSGTPPQTTRRIEWMSERWILKKCPECGFGRYIDDDWHRCTREGNEIVSMHLLRCPSGNPFAIHCEECGEWLKSWDKESNPLTPKNEKQKPAHNKEGG